MKAVKVTEALLRLFRERQVFHGAFDTPRWQVGDTLGVHPDARIEPYSQIFSGYRVPRGVGAFTYAKSPLGYFVRVGRYCSIAEGVEWMGPRHPAEWASTSPFFFSNDGSQTAATEYRRRLSLDEPERTAPVWPRGANVDIGNDVWIGNGAMIAPGITIGDGAIIGARSLVLKDVEPYAVVAGNPARVIRRRFSADIVERFKAAAWWDLQPADLQGLAADDPERFLDQVEAVLCDANKRPISPVCLTASEISDAGG